MDTSKEKIIGESPNPAKGSNSNKGKSCKGSLYYSSSLKSKARNPRCIGFPRTLHQVPHSIVQETERQASKEDRQFSDFHYGCAGFSVYLDGIGKDPSTDKPMAKSELPICVGLELLVGRRAPNIEPAATPASAHIHNEEDRRQIPQPRRHKPTRSAGDDFLNRFTRNADLVASGVAKNIRRAGNYVKESLSDIVYPYRGRPK